MTTLFVMRPRLLLWLVCVLPAAGIHAQIDDLQLPISLDADSTNYDGKNSMLLFEGLRLTQGPLGVQADHGRASKLDFEDSVWEFRGNVIIDTDTGHIECDSADLKFSGHQLQLGTLSGSPATFRVRRPGSGEDTYAEAGRVDYDFAAGVIEFSGNAVITEGGNQISSNYLVYNLAEQRIKAQAAASGEDRVKITYTPRARQPDAQADEKVESDAGTTDAEQVAPADPEPGPEGPPGDGGRPR
ncbi:MAG: lipopolysaccharide transport periplasmic protein LptA [Gammaproteobacteria bacterium]|nr:lipopolysaccharide transport periplasmic protein LptA [Gammaproteobacteria bacterium]MDH4256027.1 lipopolysaccharide transport periplasmic protein LptA [Gammaproteobacteria bacterium]MDH5308662.1 lipopolysaccharide transport periplasmic protein LptA [Gammaproteobacteria bacterium]